MGRISCRYTWPTHWAKHLELAKILLGIQPSDDRFRIHVSIRSQKLVVYRDDKQFLTAKISTGRNDKSTRPATTSSQTESGWSVRLCTR
jgi:hypothetical protein